MASLEEGQSDFSNSLRQLSALADGQPTPTYQYLEIFTKVPTSTSTSTPVSTQDFIDYARNVAIISPEYGGQYIIRSTINIRRTVEVSLSGSQRSQGISRMMCIEYSFSANQITGKRIDNVYRAIYIYKQNGYFNHRQLDTEDCP